MKNNQKKSWIELLNTWLTKKPIRTTTTRPPRRTTTTRPPRRTTTTTTTQRPQSATISKINAETVAKMENKNPITDKLIYSLQDPYTPKFIRNQSCWINGIENISCFSPAQLSGTYWNQRAGTLITKKHVIYARHFQIPIIQGGTPILFVDDKNNIVTRKLVSQVSSDDEWVDISIGLLDEEVPDNIKIATVLPIDYEKYIPNGQTVLLIAIDQEEKAILKLSSSPLFYNKQFAVMDLNERIAPYKPEYARFLQFSEQTIVGDSGNPVFLLLNNQLILIGCWWTAGGGPHIGSLHNIVNTMIESLSPGEAYKLSIATL